MLHILEQTPLPSYQDLKFFLQTNCKSHFQQAHLFLCNQLDLQSHVLEEIQEPLWRVQELTQQVYCLYLTLH